MKRFLLLLTCLACIRSYGQGLKAFAQLSPPERWWVVTHVFVAKQTFRLSQQVLVVCDSLKKQQVYTGNGNGDQLDAFRHTYWMALLVQHIRPRKALKLGIAHEKGNYRAFKKGQTEEGERPDSMSTVMDLINNQGGVDLGYDLKQKMGNVPQNDLIAQVIKAISEGKALMLQKDSAGRFLSCNGVPVDLPLYKTSWYVPKCLAPTY